VSSPIIIYGAGAVGGAIGHRLHRSGAKVILIAHDRQRAAIERTGLRVESASGVHIAHLPVVGAPAAIDWVGDEIVLLTMKGQHTDAALNDLEVAARSTISIVCAQNGVDNERLALRRFADVYSIVVHLPATHLEPGVVIEHSAPIPGSLDVGRYPHGADEKAERIAALLRVAGFASDVRADIMRWKYSKLLRNLDNAAQALFDGVAGTEAIHDRALAEALAAFAAAGIDYIDAARYDARLGGIITIPPSAGKSIGARGSSWQSLARGAGSIESNQLNGEVVLLGRLHGVPTPVNEALRRAAIDAARGAASPKPHDPRRFLEALECR
jgi:2-dehydropantoate 2-reductase